MKKKLGFALLAIVGMVFGYGIGLCIGSIIDNSSEGKPFDIMTMIWALGTSLLALIVSFFVNTVLHEAGHLVGGLLTGYKFLSFRIGNLTLQKETDGFHWKKFNISGTLGQCLMEPPHTTAAPYFWYNVGGVLVNLIICIISGLALCFLELSIVAAPFCIMLLVTGAFLLVMNAMPMKAGGVPNDGMNILILWRHPDQRKYFHNMMAIVAGQSNGIRLKDMPEEWFDSVPTSKSSTVMEFSARNLYYSRLMDEFCFEEARLVTEELMEFEEDIPTLFRLELAGDRLLLELVTLNRLDIVTSLWDKKIDRMELKKYIDTSRKYQPLKNAILYAYELINNKNPEAAKTYYDEVKAKLDSYAQKGEALTALAIMENVMQKSTMQ